MPWAPAFSFWRAPCSATTDSLRGVAIALVGGAGLSALLGLAERVGWPLLAPAQLLFKESPTLVGGDLRISASFQYATMAAQYYEMIIPLAILLAARRGAGWLRHGSLGVAMICTVALVLTLTRSAMGTLLLLLLLLLALALRRPALRALARPTRSCCSRSWRRWGCCSRSRAPFARG